MKLTEKEAITLTQEMWRELAKTGERKFEYFARKEIILGEQPFCDCYLCEYSSECDFCPYFKYYNRHCEGSRQHPTIYDKWQRTETPEKRKFWAAKFLVMLNRL